MHAARPILKVPRPVTELIVGTIAVLGVITAVAVALWGYGSVTGPIPTHFGADGRPDAWGEKGNLLILPGIAVLLFAGLSVLERFPHKFNFVVPITPQNAAAQYQNARSLVVWLKAMMVWLFVYIEWQTVAAATGLGGSSGLGVALIPLFIFADLMVLAIHLSRMSSLK